MFAPFNDTYSVLVARLSNGRRAGRLLGLLLAALVCLPATARAQVGTEVLVQLEMLDTSVNDLMQLATDYADALRDWKSAKLSIDTVQTLRPSAVVTNLEVQIARVNLEASEGKLRILRAIAEKQLAAAENKVEIVRRLEQLQSPLTEDDNGQRPPSYVLANDQATVDILRMILAMK